MKHAQICVRRRTATAFVFDSAFSTMRLDREASEWRGEEGNASNCGVPVKTRTR